MQEPRRATSPAQHCFPLACPAREVTGQQTSLACECGGHRGAVTPDQPAGAPISISDLGRLDPAFVRTAAWSSTIIDCHGALWLRLPASARSKVHSCAFLRLKTAAVRSRVTFRCAAPFRASQLPFLAEPIICRNATSRPPSPEYTAWRLAAASR